MTIEELVGCGVIAWTARTAIECVSGSVEGFWPERRGHGGVEQKGTNAVIESAQDTLGTPVLLRCVWTCETKDDAISRKERPEHMIIEFFPIVCLQAGDGCPELSANKGMEIDDSGQDIRFIA
jgi:hypothetical protein